MVWRENERVTWVVGGGKKEVEVEVDPFPLVKLVRQRERKEGTEGGDGGKHGHHRGGCGGLSSMVKPCYNQIMSDSSKKMPNLHVLLLEKQ